MLTHLLSLADAIRRDDPEAHSDAVLHFHRTIVEASRNRAFLTAWDALQWGVRMRVAVQRAHRVHFDMSRLVPAHAEILAALRAGDGERAGRLLREYLVFVMEALSEEPTPRPLPQPMARVRRRPTKARARQAP